jgi:hypothetical protein
MRNFVLAADEKAIGSPVARRSPPAPLDMGFILHFWAYWLIAPWTGRTRVLNPIGVHLR